MICDETWRIAVAAVGYWNCPTPLTFVGNNVARAWRDSRKDGVVIAAKPARSMPSPEMQTQVTPTKARLTLDGSAELERRLAVLCRQIGHSVSERIGRHKLDALVLGGGYGRGQGGVLRTEGKDAPYNDLEFYVFVKGNSVLNARRYRSSLDELSKSLSPAAGLHV